MRILITGFMATLLWLGSMVGAWADEPLHTPLPVSTAMTEGAPLFEMHCAGCHINGGNIIRRGKTLKQKALEKNGYDSVEAIAQLVTQGKGNMPAYSDRLSPAEIETVATYVLEQAAQNWKP